MAENKGNPAHLVPMDLFAQEPIRIDLVYADALHPENIFKTAIYHPNARLSLHKDLARIVLRCARMMNKETDWTLILKDGLRTVDCQERLMETSIVRENPQWLSGPSRLLSSPGQGAHPRGMAIDVSVLNADGNIVDMGTPFDGMSEKSARTYKDLPDSILANRTALERHFADAARHFNLPLLPLPSEWWDYRFPSDYYGGLEPFSELDLPPPLRMREPGTADQPWKDHTASLAKDILLSL